MNEIHVELTNAFSVLAFNVFYAIMYDVQHKHTHTHTHNIADKSISFLHFVIVDSEL